MISMSGGDPTRAATFEPVPEERLRVITGLHNRLDETEAELAAVSIMARKRGLDYLRAEGRPLLDELGDLVARLRALILEDGPRGHSIRDRASSRALRS